MANAEGLYDFEYDPRHAHHHHHQQQQQQHSHHHGHHHSQDHGHSHYQHQHHPHPQHQHPLNPRFSWPVSHVAAASPAMAVHYKRASSPLPLSMVQESFRNAAGADNPPAMMRDWHMTAPAPSLPFALDTASFPQQAFDPYAVSFHASPTDYLPPHASLDVSIDAGLQTGLSLDASSYMALPADMAAMAAMNPLPINWHEVDNQLITYATTHALSDMASARRQFSAGSPSETYLSDGHLEVRSLPSSCSDNGWTAVDHVLPPQHVGAIFDPAQTLHPRTWSDSSYSDVEQHSQNSWDFVDAPNPLNSPTSDGTGERDFYFDQGMYYDNGGSSNNNSNGNSSNNERPSPPPLMTTALVKPIAIRQAASSQRSSPISPATRRQPRKTPIAKSAKATATRKGLPNNNAGGGSNNNRNETEKRVGRRKGPLRPDQRKQASEIRKLGACIRCRFLKKTCDKGDPCAGCQPSHARLWLVPCTRIDIKDLGYFLKGWKADYERHVSLGFSVGNIKGFSDKEKTLFVTHGYGHCLPVQAREVYVRDETVFGVSWVETRDGKNREHEIDTAKLSAGMEGVSTAMLSEYLDRHIDGGWDGFVDEHFGGTPFVTEILKTAYRFWTREKTPVIRKALKLVLAYNLTQAVCLVKAVGSEDPLEGKIEDEESYFNGETAAPVMINFQVKCGLADMWRELQKDILEELSTLYSSIYSRDKLKHWPTIFMLASILLVVWEEMQFDCRYRVPDAAAVEKFCNDMETTPVGVIVGLFSAISQKVPAFSEWDTRKHHMLLNSNPAVCSAMEEVKEHLAVHEKYLRARSQAVFDREDFDCLSNKFVSKLVIRAH